MHQYEEYLWEQAKLDAMELPELVRHMTLMTKRPRFVILVEGGDERNIQTTVSSIDKQIYPAAEVVLDKTAWESQTEECCFLVMLEAGDQLHKRALYEFACRIIAAPSAQVIYCDEDVMSLDGKRKEPFVKPDWSPDYLEAMNYIGTAACYSAELAQELLLQADGQYDFTLRFVERTRSVEHVRKILLHRKSSPKIKSEEAAEREMRALSARLERTGRKGKIEQNIARSGSYRAILQLSRKPLVSIIIPTAGKIVSVDGRTRDLIAACIESIVKRSTHQRIEFVIVDNGDFERGRLDYIREVPIRYVTFGEPQINIARKMNMGVARAAGEFLLLLNDDTEILTPDWIERLLYHFEKPHVGAVGAKLLYTDMSIQHAGGIVTSGSPVHVSRWMSQYDPGYFFSNAGARNFLWVTAAALMTTARHYREVRGFDEALPLYFNDCDFCMKLISRGMTVVYEPNTELTHFESLSAIPSHRPEDKELYFKKWGHVATDPYYNENLLALRRPTFAFANNLRTI
jgi:GT2 family glycosyltransferase